MARLPQVGGDDGNWGQILNDYLLESHDTNGSIKDGSIGSDQLAPAAVTTTKLANDSVTNAKIAGYGDPNGVATLDATGLLPESQLPVRLNGANLDAFMDDIQQGVDSAEQAADTAVTARTTATQAASDAQDSATSASSAATNADSAKAAAEVARDETVVAVAIQQDWTGTVTLTQAQTRSAFLRRRLVGNTTVTLAPGAANLAYSCSLELQQDSVGSRTIALTNVYTSYSIPLTLTTAAEGIDLIRLEWNGVHWRAFLSASQLGIPSSWAGGN